MAKGKKVIKGKKYGRMMQSKGMMGGMDKEAKGMHDKACKM